jgi:cephalosporin-C deacetylase
VKAGQQAQAATAKAGVQAQPATEKAGEQPLPATEKVGQQPLPNLTGVSEQPPTPEPLATTVHGEKFDPSYGLGRTALEHVGSQPPPPGYEDFWKKTYQDTVSVPPNVRDKKLLGQLGDHDLYEIHYSGADGKTLGGWLAMPHSGEVDSGVVVTHGYGGPTMPNEDAIRRDGGPKTALLYPSSPGFELSPDATIPGDANKNVVTGIENRDTYSVKASVSAVWSSASALLAEAPGAAGHLYLQGTSFGGGIGTMALAWDKRFNKAFFEVPTFGNQPLRLEEPTRGSGEAVRDLIAAHPEEAANVKRTLAFYDASTAARYIDRPTMVSAGLKDEMVPPPGQFSIYNALPKAVRRLFVLKQGHVDLTAKEDADRLKARRQFFGFDV